MTLKPCLGCGEPSEGRRCEECAPSPSALRGLTAAQRGYDHKWNELSKRARAAQPWCSDCGATERLTTDHTPQAWRRKAKGLEIRLRDVDVVCNDCNVKRGSSRPGSRRAQ